MMPQQVGWNPTQNLLPMGRTKTLALATAIAMLWILATGGSAFAAARCTEPEPTLSYDVEELFIDLKVDYHGCSWWHGKSIELTVEITSGPIIGRGFGAHMECTDFAERNGRVKQVTTYECGVGLGLGHLPAEAATYSAFAEHPWKGGTERTEFELVCVSAVAVAECHIL